MFYIEKQPLLRK